MTRILNLPAILIGLTAVLPLACLTPPGAGGPPGVASPATAAARPPTEPMKELDAWTAVPLLTPGINIGNTLDNTTAWETGWGNPPITKEFVESVARLGFKSVRLPVAWDTYATAERIDDDKFRRVGEVVDWIVGAGMFCVLNIHWDGGWIDSGPKDKFPATHATFSADAQRKFPSYWQQISTYFAGRSEKLIFEGLNEETEFKNAGSTEKAYATLTRVNQIFIDTVRKTGGNNAKRLLVVTGYSTDIEKTCAPAYKLPKDTIPGRMFISVHYYTPYQFCGLEQDADWGKMMPTWGTPEDEKQLETLFDKMKGFSTTHDIPVYLGEYGVTNKREAASRQRWMSAVTKAAVSRKMVPVFWDTGSDVSRHPPHTATNEMAEMLKSLAAGKTP